MRTLAAILLCGVMTLGCGPSTGGSGGDDDGDDDGPDPGDVDARGGGGSFPDARTGGGTRVDGGPGAIRACQKMDILFVIDDSGSMVEEQDNLGENFPAFAQVLNDYRVEGDRELDYRLAITTTGRALRYDNVTPAFPPFFPEIAVPVDIPGENGAFRQECGMTRRWLERTDPDLPTTFACAANVGTDGSSMEMPMYASQMALADRVGDGTNAGFLRDDALLAIVYLTDEDDCSRTDNNFRVMLGEDPCANVPASYMPAHLVEFLDELKGARGRWAAAAIAGPSDCESEFGSAVQARRLQEFVGLVGTNAVFSSICEGSLAPALEQALDTFQAACASFPDVD